ncbi:ATP-binding protein, partial [Brachyspira catarrhinii]
MKLIKLLQTPHEYYCLKSYKEYLTKLYANAREGKDPNCRKCDDEGYIKTKKNIAFGKREWSIPELCDCVKSEKTEETNNN